MLTHNDQRRCIADAESEVFNLRGEMKFSHDFELKPDSWRSDEWDNRTVTDNDGNPEVVDRVPNVLRFPKPGIHS